MSFFVFLFLFLMKKSPFFYKYILVFLCVVCGLTFAQSQSLDSQIETQSQRLEQLQEEIRQYREELSAAEEEEQSLLEELNVLDREISYTRQLINQMERALQERRQRIELLTERLQENQAKIAELKDRFARRAVNIYKHGRLNDLELLLSSESMDQALYRYKYLRVINEADRKLFDAILNTMQAIESDRAQLQIEQQEQEELLVNQRREEQRLVQDQARRSELLAEVQNEAEEYKTAIAEREQSTQELQSIIADLAEQRRLRENEEDFEEQTNIVMRESTVDIPSLKGRLPWPARGEIITKFGKFQHPKLNTITDNPGIDIAAPEGTDVVAVLDGVVTTITWMRGYGNTIIIDHGDGYYTVYAHVIEVQVSENTYVNAGDVIANVGDSGSLEGVKLHFEIYENNIKVNPEIWLAQIS